MTTSPAAQGDVVRLLSGRLVTVDEACEILDVSPIVQRFGTWAATDYGVECLTSRYAIERAHLRDMDWHRHLLGASWLVDADLRAALDYALAVRNISADTPEWQKISDKGRTPRPGKTRPKPSPRLRFLVLKRDGYTCQLCGRTAANGVQLDVDHKVAQAIGGSNDITNLWTLCSPCNNGKGVEEL